MDQRLHYYDNPCKCFKKYLNQALARNTTKTDTIHNNQPLRAVSVLPPSVPRWLCLYSVKGALDHKSLPKVSFLDTE